MHGSWDGELGMLCVVPSSVASLWGPLWISFYARDQVKISAHFADEENRGLSKEKFVAIKTVHKYRTFQSSVGDVGASVSKASFL